MTVPARGYLGYVAAATALGAIYLAGAGAVRFAPDHGPVASWWPAAGIAVALLTLAPRPWWPVLITGIVVFSGAANLTGGRDLTVSTCFGVANAAEAVVAALILTRRDEAPRLLSLDDFVRLVRAAVVGAVTIATGAALTVVVFDTGPFLESWIAVFASHAASTLVIVPIALARSGGTARRRTGELAVQAVALFAVTFLVFDSSQPLSLAFAPLPLLVWAALRLDIRVVTLQLVGVSVLCTVLTAEGRGPFGAAVTDGTITPELAGTMVQIWLLSAAVMSLPLGLAVEQRRQLLADVTAREELFRRNFTDSLTGMLLLSPRGDRLEVIDANAAARRLLGGEEIPLLGRYLDRVLDQPATIRRHLQEVVSGDLAGWTSETGLADNPEVRVNIAVSVLAAGSTRLYSAQLLDVTAERRSQELLVAALEKERTAVHRLRRLDEAKTEFVATVSHELRTPVTSIVGYTELLQTGDVVAPLPEQQQMLEIIARNGERLLTLCNDLLTLGGPEDDASDRGAVDLTALLGHVEQTARSMLDGRRLDLTFAHPGRPVLVTGDRGQLERALQNVLGNAIKFTEDGGRVTCRLDARDGEVSLEIADTGIGIPVEEQDGLFQKFFRSSTAQQRAIPGTGLGLSIVAGIVASHDGRIDVTSTHLEGTTLTVWLPVRER